MVDDDARDRAEIHDLFNRYADAVSGHQWELLDEVFTEDVTGTWRGCSEIEGRAALVRLIRDVIEGTPETHLFGNYSASIDGDVAMASVRVRVYQVFVRGPSGRYQKILGSFRAKLVRTGNGWRFRHLAMGRSAIAKPAQV